KARTASLSFESSGLSRELATELARLEPARMTIPASRLAVESGAPFETAAKAVFAAIERLDVQAVRTAVADQGFTDYFDRLAISSALADIDRTVLRAASADLSGDAAVARRIEIAADRLRSVVSAGDLTVSRLTVAAGQMRDIVGA
ncbi:MAG: hypothetical protein AAFU50_01025, partial [Pseudomonadota bacterium]